MSKTVKTTLNASLLTAAASVSVAAPALASSHHLSAARRAVAAVTAATDRAPVIVSRDDATLHGQPLYSSYSDRATKRSATYLEGKLSQGSIGSTLYAANGSCFKHEHLAGGFVGLSTIANAMLPSDATYTLQGHTLTWRLGATKAHGAEMGVVTFNAHDLITDSTTKPYKTAGGRTEAQSVTLSYPAKLPAYIPAKVPAPACNASHSHAASLPSPQQTAQQP